MKYSIIFIVLISLFMVYPLDSQQKPDFSGQWTFNKEKSKLGIAELANLEKGTVKIEHNDPIFKMYRTFTIDGQDDSISLDLKADGKEIETTEDSYKTYSRLSWEGDTLVFVTRYVASEGEATNTVKYRLLDNGKTLQADENFVGPKLHYNNMWVFEKN